LYFTCYGRGSATVNEKDTYGSNPLWPVTSRRRSELGKKMTSKAKVEKTE